LALKFSAQKGVDFCGEESVTVAVTREAVGLIRDPAPLAMLPLRGFGGDGAGIPSRVIISGYRAEFVARLDKRPAPNNTTYR
jgi:hypothetical protein